MKKILGLILFLGMLFALDVRAQEPSLYILDAGDTLRVNVFGEETLSGDFQVGNDGFVAIPLIGDVKAKGLTINELKHAIEDKLSPDYLIDPQVSVDVLNYRPFYILGEVNEPGSYPFVSGLTVIEAVAMAGGFTYRAKTKEVLIKRGEGEGSEFVASLDETILPGDVIRVRERIF